MLVHATCFADVDFIGNQHMQGTCKFILRILLVGSESVSYIISFHDVNSMLTGDAKNGGGGICSMVCGGFVCRICVTFGYSDILVCIFFRRSNRLLQMVSGADARVAACCSGVDNFAVAACNSVDYYF